MYPDISPDGQKFVFAKVVGDKASKDKSIWIANIDGSNPRLLANSGTYPSFSADGKRVFFERGRNKVMVVNISDSIVSEFFPRDIEAFAGREIAVPSVSPNERYIAVTIDYPKKWKTWVYDFKTEDFFILGHGCQGNWLADSNSLFWVERGSFNSVSALSIYDVKSRINKIFHDHGEPHGQEYFPYVTRDNELLLWAASPKDEHSHYTANYQLFYRKIDSPKRHQITNDSHTNRWPKMYRESKNLNHDANHNHQ